MLGHYQLPCRINCAGPEQPLQRSHPRPAVEQPEVHTPLGPLVYGQSRDRRHYHQL